MLTRFQKYQSRFSLLYRAGMIVPGSPPPPGVATAPVLRPRSWSQWWTYQGPTTAAPTTTNASTPRQLRQPPRTRTTRANPAMKSTNGALHICPSPAASPARAAIGQRSNRRLARISQTVTATIAAVGASTMNSWNWSITMGVASANTAASTPARRP